LPGNVYYISHPEVFIDPAIPVPQWALSQTGLARVEKLLQQPWISTIGAVYSSTERKAVMLGERIAEFVGVALRQMAELSEVDRSSTGYLPPGEHEALVAELFARPNESIRGWERAADAQRRTVEAVERIRAEAPSNSIAIAAHGGVGAFLICHLKGIQITRAEDQRGLGNYFVIEKSSGELVQGWRAMDSIETAPAEREE
jgi:broad specificity phosphatase PhoE